MLSIFNDERLGHAPFLSDPARDGAHFDRGRVANALCGITTPRRPLLTPVKIRRRHGGVIIVIRP